MKSIREFVTGKIRRTESEDRLSVTEGPPHAAFGACEGVLSGPRGRVSFFERGMTLEGAGDVAYAEIARVMIEPASRGDERFVDVILADGSTKRLVSSAIGGEVVYATLRWIGNAVLRRKIAD